MYNTEGSNLMVCGSALIVHNSSPCMHIMHTATLNEGRGKLQGKDVKVIAVGVTAVYSLYVVLYIHTTYFRCVEFY